MKIVHRADMVEKFTNLIMKDFYETSIRSRKGFHRSDLISCPLKCYWRITGEKSQHFTSRDVGTLVLGTLAHIALHRNFKAQEKEFKVGGIYITVDAIYDEDGVEYPVETKTTRRKIFQKEKIPQEWIEQLCLAIAVMDVPKGYLMIVNMINFAITVWEISLTKIEREMFLQTAIWQALALIDAIKKKNPKLLTPKYKECKWCPYRPTRRNPNGCPFYKPLKD